MAERVQVNVQDVPEAIRDRVVAEARERDLSITNVVGEIVARCHGLEWTVGGQALRRKASGELPSGEPPWVLRFPRELVDKLQQTAREAGGRRVAKSRLILGCLAEHYGLSPQSPLNRSLGQPRDPGGRYVRRD